MKNTKEKDRKKLQPSELAASKTQMKIGKKRGLDRLPSRRGKEMPEMQKLTRDFRRGKWLSNAKKRRLRY